MGFVNLPCLDEVLERAELRWRLRNYSEDERQRKRKILKKEYSLYSQARKMGEGAREISRRLKLPYWTVHRWPHGQLPKALGHATKPFDGNIPHTHDENFAYLLGVTLANFTFGDRVLRNFTFLKSRDTNVFERIKLALATQFGEDTVKVEELKRLGTRCIFRRRAFFEHLYFSTEDYTSVPWENLGSKDEKIAFLKGLCDVSLCVTNRKGMDMPERLTVHKSKSPKTSSFFKGLAVLMNDVGLNPLLRESKNLVELRLTDADDVRLLLDEGCVPERHLEAVAELKAYRQIMLVDRVGKRQGRNTHALARAIASRYGVDKPDWKGTFGKVSGWRRSCFKPDVVKRDEEIMGLRIDEIPGDIVAVLYRHFGFSPKQAREIARKYTGLDSLYGTMEQLDVMGVEKEELFNWLMMGPWEIEEKFSVVSERIGDYRKSRRFGLSVHESLKLLKSRKNLPLDFIRFCFEECGVDASNSHEWFESGVVGLYRKLDEEHPLFLSVNGSGYKLPWRRLQTLFEAYDIDIEGVGDGELQVYLDHLSGELPERKPKYNGRVFEHTGDNLKVSLKPDGPNTMGVVTGLSLRSTVINIEDPVSVASVRSGSISESVWGGLEECLD